MKIGIGTGNFWTKEHYDINEAIKEIYQLGVDHIEITFGHFKGFREFQITPESLGLLQKFKFKVVHAPCDPYGDKESKEVLTELKEFYDLIKADHISFHPHYFEDFNILLDFNWNVCIENSRPGKGWGFEKYKNLFSQHPQFSFVLDTDHAGEFSREEIDLLFNEFKDKIAYFHLSAAHKDKRHHPLHLIDGEYLNQFDKIFNFGKPLIIELWQPDIKTLKKEVEFLQAK